MRAQAVALVLLAVIAAGCSGDSDSPADAPEPTPQDGVPLDLDVNGHSLQIQCTGEGSPTVVLIAGLGTDRHTWDPLVPELASHSRVCAYDRAGLGSSEPSDDASPTPGSMAAELHELLEAANLKPPYVLGGHSYGGMVARVFAHEYQAEVDGLLLVDSAVEGEFTNGFFADIDWVEGGADIDTASGAGELRAVDALGAMPVVVLTQGKDLRGRFGELWTRWQGELAEMSANTVHVSAIKSGHVIQEDQPGLVIQGIADLVAAAGGDLPRCDARYADLDSVCL